MKYCIIDDEPIAHRILEGYCEKLPFLQKVGNCYDAVEAIPFLTHNHVDLVFLDINMPTLSGFELLRTMQQSPKVIVTSAHKEFALEGYELNVLDYLLKPFSLQRFLKAMNTVVNYQNSALIATSVEKKSRFFLKGDKKIHQLHTDDILFIEAYGNYTKVFLANEVVISHEKISALEKLLPESAFLRVHKSFIINCDKIKTIEGNRITITEHMVPIGQTYKHNLKKLFSE